MHADGYVLVAVAGLLCGLVNTVAGGGSLILFPAMVVAGLPALTANVTNSVATWPGYLGGVGGFQRELREEPTALRGLALATVAGSTTGCILLLLTPSGAFDLVVPALVFVASALVGLQPWIARRLGHPTGEGRRWRYPAIFAATIYGGYFGGALGVIILATLVLSLPGTIARLTALKTVLSLVDCTVSVVIFGLFGPVRWTVVAVAAPTTLVGGYLGAHVARALRPPALRASVVLLGLAAAIYLAVIA
ncbi:MAG TPA: sulfite exporter TauE/SafE family protein [Acidimicrobiales bacterium]|jgi:uncharacterized membrane protein YfcA|nr:sulfite exporter TauE/SafE family protein [Acidimicrobiales bacterium]